MDNIQCRFVVMGSSGVGKSCIILRLFYNTFRYSYIETREELYTYTQTFRDSSRLKFEVLDVSGFNRFPDMRKLSISAADCFILVYEVGNEESWKEVKRLRNEIVQMRGLEIPIIIVCNKNDLNKSKTTLSIICECTALIDWECPYVVCSALNDTNIDLIFKEMLIASGARILPRQGFLTRGRNLLNRMIISVRGLLQNFI